MKSKSFYIARSAGLHEKLAAAHKAVKAIEEEINENIRLVNIAPAEDDVESAPPPPPPPTVKLPTPRPATKRA